ncbi:hypothetical protein GB931_08010 [Modestobacter sp. I12A-02628]|uniref:Uncharacterized protein n=1 Tax=Goekera deserti TaxID=2497753 RepID=A0A7K3WFB6_9ACTN|nr:hypothetical protein [Goekera deserti]MPQ97868.1 hypothetical protein [Goekera deserti]NDI48514.1 hypothetical protein [Goekera deserti]NEL55107.1 hypothetical protein [Goekera deserti]
MTIPTPRQPLADADHLLAALGQQVELLGLDAPLAPAALRPRVQRDAGALAELLRSLPRQRGPLAAA